MPLEFTCPACEKSLTAPFAAAGKAGVCKFCQARIIAPAGSGRPATLAPGAESAAAAGVGASKEPGIGGPDPFAPPPPHAPSGGYTAPGYHAMPPSDIIGNPQAATAFMSAGRPTIADFWKRTLAFLIDLIFIIGIQVVLEGIMLGGREGVVTSVLFANKAQFGAALHFTMTLFAGKILYGAILESSPLQGTIGKVLLGMRVCTEQGERISLLAGLWRNFCKWASVSLVSFVPIIGWCPYIIFYYATNDELTQALHDMCAGTVVADRN